ncbi:MAG: DNA-binding response OmpR family regulator [Planctomycetota bacterium]|jgi:DNA-binding response OmpR family regulator
MNKNVLIIEDNSDIANLVMINLRGKHLLVDRARDGEQGLQMALRGNYDLVILDLMLPFLDGLDVCRAMRKEKLFTPVLMLTARSSELDRVLGLEVGADDYLSKPFSVPELIARVNAMLRRSDQYQESSLESLQEVLNIGPLSIDSEQRLVSVDGIDTDLTVKEFDLLWHFANHPGRVYSRSQLLDSVWGIGHDGYEHTVNSHINRLRSKIEQDPSNPELIVTVWGVGYKFLNESNRRSVA